MATTAAKKRSSSKSAKGGDATATSDTEALFPAVQGSEAAYNRFLQDALAIPANEVRPFRADASLAYHNALEGVNNVMAKKAELRAALPREDFGTLQALPDVVLGLTFAVLSAQGSREQPRLVREELREARDLRRVLLKGFDALKEAGFFTQTEYDAIAAGHGPLDAANDCIALAAKYRTKWDTIGKKTAVTPAQLARASELGTKLQAHFKPGRARRSNATTGPAAEAIERRDRFWTLATRIAERLWRVGALAFGRAVDDHVPALQSSRRKSTAAGRAVTAQKVADRAVAQARKAATQAEEAAAKKPGKKRSP